MKESSRSTSARQLLLTMLVRHSYNRAEYPKYRLTSGGVSDTYINCRATTTLADAGPLIGELCASLVPAQAEGIGGMTMGADPIAYAVSAYCKYVKGVTLNSFVVRKTPKGHGLNLFVEGTPGKRVVVVDDVVTTGASTIQAIQRCRNEGIEVLAVIVLVDREEGGGLQAVQEAAGKDVPVHALFRKSELEKHFLSESADRTAAN